MIASYTLAPGLAKVPRRGVNDGYGRAKISETRAPP
jgi:hypothetical protein